MRPGKPDWANTCWRLSDEEPCDSCGGTGTAEFPGCWGSGRQGDLHGHTSMIEGRQVTKTIWVPDDGERRALANGAPIELYVWGRQPPVALDVGEPSVVVKPLLHGMHVERALDLLGERLRERHVAARFVKGPPDEAELRKMWHRALVDSAPDGTSVSSRRAAG